MDHTIRPAGGVSRQLAAAGRGLGRGGSTLALLCALAFSSACGDGSGPALLSGVEGPAAIANGSTDREQAGGDHGDAGEEATAQAGTASALYAQRSGLAISHGQRWRPERSEERPGQAVVRFFQAQESLKSRLRSIEWDPDRGDVRLRSNAKGVDLHDIAMLVLPATRIVDTDGELIGLARRVQVSEGSALIETPAALGDALTMTRVHRAPTEARVDIDLQPLEAGRWTLRLSSAGAAVTASVDVLFLRPGRHRLANGMRLSAGRVARAAAQTDVIFGQPFAARPLVFARHSARPSATLAPRVQRRGFRLAVPAAGQGEQSIAGELTFLAVAPAAIDSPALIDAARLLAQATMGARDGEAERLAAWGVDAWFAEQRALAGADWRSRTEPYMAKLSARRRSKLAPGKEDQSVPYRERGPRAEDPAEAINAHNFSTPWMRNVIWGRDQLQQRINWHLSQLLVASYAGDLHVERIGGRAISTYYDLLGAHAAGNYRELLEAVTLSPLMGRYLSHLGNAVSTREGETPDENYAREIMQLFSIGLWELNPDGSLQRDAAGQKIATYTQADVSELARVFTGLGLDGGAWRLKRILITAAHRVPMKVYEQYHDRGAKTLFAGKRWARQLPAGNNTMQDIDAALDALFEHPNTPVYFAQRLIQYLVTSNPSADYVARVAAVFADNGEGVRGDIMSTAIAVLRDPRARDPISAQRDPHFGKLQEPLLRFTRLVRAFDIGRDLPGATALPGLQFWDPPHSFSQWPMYSPSVFNFFSPFHRGSGRLAANDLISPEMQLHNSHSAVSLPNLFQRVLDKRIHTANPAVTPAFRLRTGPFHALLTRPQRLLDRIDLLLAAGALSERSRALLLEALAQSEGQLEPSARLRLILWLAAVSPDVAILR